MIIDLEATDGALSKSCDVCIIGGGVAGQTLAIALGKAGIKPVILESGGRDFRADTQYLASGQNIGEDYYELRDSRLRLFGGSAAIWGGRCAELDPIDFEKRDYIPHSGWPITKTDLDPYYAHAFSDLGLKRPGEGRLWSEIGRTPPEFDPSKIDADLWAFDEEGERFTDLSRDGLARADIILNATVTEMDVNAQGETRSVTAKSLKGQDVRVTAKAFVVASGAIETVRLLMGAVPARPKGLGNEKDVLGRFFMEHPHARGGEIIPKSLAQALTLVPRALRVDGHRYAAYLRPSPDLQRAKGILNTSISFAPRRREGAKMEVFRAATNKLKHDLPSAKRWRTLYHGVKALAIRGLEKTDPWGPVINMKLNGNKMGVFAISRAEQAPNPDSRITLGEVKDALGLRQAVLDWQFVEQDKRSVRVLMDTLGDEFTRLGWGRVEPSAWLSDSDVVWKTDPLISAHHIGGYHHMGGTRMGTNRTSSVVDADCKLHDSPNTFIASSSVFPTGGWANPTITIIALALRLGDHLGQKLRT